MSGKIIFVEGVPGCGKTTFCKMLADPNTVCYASLVGSLRDTVILEEWVDPQFLAEYIADMPNLAAQFQRRAQEELAKKLEVAINLIKQGVTVIIDRGVIGNQCFAELQHYQGFISSEFMKWYRQEFALHNMVPHHIPYEIWYLTCDIPTVMNRISLRDRNGEGRYTADYLRWLSEIHDQLLVGNATQIIDVSSPLDVIVCA